ncbi:MAG: hypothetical protein P8X89_16255 [Reinekea sp.]
MTENRLGDIPNFVPRIKNMDFINFIREQLPPDTDKKEYPCAYKLTDELILTYAIDNDEAFIHVSPAMLEQYEISAEQMRDIGERNCVEILRDLHVKSQDGYYRLFAPEHMTACTILFAELWQQIKEEQGCDVVVGFAHRDAVFYCPAHDALARKAMKSAMSNDIEQDQYRLSQCLYQYTESGWQIVDDQEEPWVS